MNLFSYLRAFGQALPLPTLMASLMASLVVTGLVSPAFAVRPEPDSGAHWQNPTEPFRTGFKHLRPLRPRDLLNQGETLRNQKLALSGQAIDQIMSRLNARARASGGEFRVRSVDTDAKGNRHIRIQQYHRGLQVIGADAVIHVNAANEVYASGGSLAESLKAGAQPRLQVDAARAQVRSALRLKASAIEKQAPRLVIFDGALAYETLVEEPGTPPRRWRSFLDAETGALLFRENRILHGAPVGGVSHAVTGAVLTGEGGQNDTIQGWRDDLNLYFLRNNTARWGVYDQDLFDWSQNATGNWGATDRAAVSLARNMELTQNYVSQVLGRNSYDNAGAFANAYVHEGSNYVNAYWDGSGLHFGDGDGVTAAPLTVLDVAAHEFGHALTQYTSDLIYSYESGALNESYSDIMGTLVELWSQPDGRSVYPAGADGQADYLVGEDCWLTSEALRDMRNPGRFGQPSYYQGTNWYTGSGDNGGVHYNSGVQNFAFYLLAEGGTGSNDGHPYSITGLGIEAAGEIAMYANMYLLTSTAQYQDAREAWILAATTLGHNVQTVRDVWTACGVLAQVNHLAVNPANLHFGGVGLGTTGTLQITFTNNGANPTTITALGFDQAVFTSPAALPLIVAGGANVTVPIRFTPAALGSASGVLTVTSNALDNPVITIPLAGTGAVPASLSLTPPSFAVSLPVGGSVARDLTITNTGTGDALDWTLQGLSLTTPAIAASVSGFAPGNGLGTSDATTIDILAWVPYTDMTWEYPNLVAAIDSFSNPHTITTSSTFSAATLETELADKDLFLMPERELGSIPTGTGTAFRPVLQAFLQRGGVVILQFPYQVEATQFLNEAGLMQVAIGTMNWTGNCVIQDPSHPLLANVTAPLTMVDATAAVTVLDSSKVLATYSGYAVLAEKSIGSGRVIVMGPDFWAYTSNWARIISNAVNLAATSTSQWVTASQLSGQVPAGQSQTIALTFNAANLLGGTYTADVRLVHDDPIADNPMAIPTTLEVDGMRRLAATPTSLAFGGVWVGAQVSRQVTLTNGGNEATLISAITTGDTEFIVVDSLPITLQPFQSRTVTVRYVPADMGTDSTILTITSNAEDNASITLPMSGEGTTPPVLTLTPTALNATASAGDTAQRILTIGNAGGAPLRFAFEGAGAGILINEFCNSPDFIELWNRGADRNIGGWVLSWIDNAGSSVLSFTFPAGYVLRAGRRVVVRESTGASNDSTFYAGGNIGWVEGSTVSVALVNASGVGVDFVRTSTSASLPPTGTAWSGTGVAFSGYTSYRNRNVDSDDSAGWVTSYAPSEFALNPGQNQTGALPTWLTAAVDSGEVAPGGNQAVNFTFHSTGLLGGTYTGSLLVKSNDPAAPVLGTPLPVTLVVDGERRLAVSPGSLAFGQAWAGTQVVRTFTLQNVGNEATTVTAMVSNDTEFTVNSVLPLTIPAFASRTVNVVFAPVDVGAEAAILTITSDAEDAPSLIVALSGTGTTPPLASLAPNAFTLTLAPDQAPADRTATLANLGGDNLQWRIASVTQTGSPLISPFAPTAPATPITPALQAAALPPVQAERIYAASNYAHAYVPGRVIVAFKPGFTTFANTQSFAHLGVKGMRELARAIHPKTQARAHTGRKLLLVELQQDGRVLEAIESLRQDAHVAYAEPDFIQKIVATPNDPSFSLLYGMHNSGQSGGVADADIDAPEAWNRHTGNRSLLIGVIDTGIDYLHPDLAANMWTNPGEIAGNGVDDDGNGFIDDVHGWDFAYDDSNPTDGHYHGTHCAGTVAGVGNNGIGVAGVMWEANLVALKFLDDGGSGTTSDAIDAVNYATAMDIRITSNSWGGGGFSQALMDAIATGGLFIAAAGNSGSNNDLSPQYPASYPLDNIISVAATDHTDARASFSCFGLTSVDLGAPGVNTYSTTPGNSYQYLSGTSMATPHVSGAAGLVWTFNPTLTAAEVKTALMASVDPIPSMAGITVTGGRLNVQAALDEAGPTWLAASPTLPGTLAPGDSTPITVTVNPAGLVAGQWTGIVTLATDDPAHPELPISVTAHITGCRALTVNPVSHAFGSRFIGSVTQATLTLTNTCNDAVTISASSSDASAFSLAATLPLVIPAFQNVTVPVEFRPLTAGNLAGTLSLTTNADADSVKTVALSGLGVEPPVATANPSLVNQTLDAGQSAILDLDIGNTGGSDLNWTLANVDQGLLPQAPATPSAPYDATHFAAQPRGEPDTRIGHPVTQAAGGPDAFGYRWSDSDAPDGPAYQWQDIQTTGTRVLQGCLDCYVTQNLSFNFPFYGNQFSQMNITSKGWINFGVASYQWTNYPLPGASMPENLIAAFFDDLTTSNSGSGVYFQDFGNRAVIQYQGMGFYTGTGTLTFQIVIHASGEINYYYQNMNGSVLSGTTGIQNSTRTVGLQMQYNTAYVRNGLAVRISTLPEWLRISALSGTVTAGNSQRLALTLDAGSLTPGVYTQTMTLEHNNPLLPPIQIPVTLTVGAGNPVGYSRVLRVGPSALPVSAGSRFALWNVTVGGETRGQLQGSRFNLTLK